MDILEGIRVIDVTMWAFGPAAGGVMAHWGADVIKVENPKAPDPMRLQGGTLEPGDSGFVYKHYSRGKRAIALDLSTDEGREILYKLCEGADVFVTSFLPETRKKLKFDVDDIRARNPNIIYARVTGHGPRGPEAERGGYDSAVWWSRSSLCYTASQEAGLDTPVRMIGHGDGMSGMTLVSGICAALLKRERTGVPSVVDGSLLGTGVWFNGVQIMLTRQGGTALRPPGAAHEGAYYRTKDNRYAHILMLGNNDPDWKDLCEHLERPDLVTDPRFATPKARVENRDAGREILAEVIAQRTLDEWKKVFLTLRGVWAPIQSPAEMYDDPQVIANGFLRETKYPTTPLTVPIPPILFDEEGGDAPPAPDFAAHTDEVLHEIGMSDAELARLRAASVIA